jgi:hypothetical protein
MKNRQKGATPKISQNLTKPARIDLKICPDEIQPGTYLSPKIHRLGLIETPGKSDHGQKRKTFPKNENHSTSEERKSQARMKNLRG